MSKQSPTPTRTANDDYRDQLTPGALTAYERLLAAAAEAWEWECHTYYSGTHLVTCLRPQEPPLNFMDGRLSPAEFNRLVAFATREQLKVEEVLRLYLTLLSLGQGSLAHTIVAEGEPSEGQRAEMSAVLVSMLERERAARRQRAS